jgi:hypothetical protein
LRDTVNHSVQVSSGPVESVAELLALPNQVSSLAGGLNASLAELVGVEIEEICPARDLAGLLGHLASNQLEEGLNVGDKRGRGWNRSGCFLV